MKSRQLLQILILLCFGCIAPQNSRSQGCQIVGHQYPTGTFTASSTGTWSTVNTEMNGGNWTLFDVTSCATYQWTYCNSYGGSENFDAELTLYNYTSGSTGALEGYSNNSELSDCPDAPLITWTCPAGVTQVQLLTTQSGCLTNTGNSYYSTLVWEEESAGQTPNAPTSASASVTNYCGGQTAPVTLFANGTLTSGAQWVWYQGGCGAGNSIGTGDEPTVVPTATATYYVREESSCGTSACASTTVNYITQPAAPTPSATPTTVCQGQMINLSANMTGSPYYWTYNGTYFSDVQNPVVSSTTYGSGSYCLEATASGCQTAQGCVPVTVAQPPTLSLNPDGNVYVCSSGANSCASVTAAGAANYVWSPSTGLNSTTGASVTICNLSATQEYTVTGTDGNGCTATSAINVNVTPTPTIALDPPAPLCEGDSASLQATGAAQSYSWSPSSGLSSTTTPSVTANPTTTTTYTVTASNTYNNGLCSATATATVTVNPLPVVSVSVSSGTITSGGSATLSASGATSYSWSNGQTGNPVIVSPTSTTSYTVTGTDANGCTATAETTVTVQTGTGISDPDAFAALSLTPNPSTGAVILALEAAEETNVEIRVFDAAGNLVWKQSTATSSGKMSQVLHMESLAKGFYTVEVAGVHGRATRTLEIQ